MPDSRKAPMSHEWLSQQQVAAEFGISDRTVRRMIADGRIPAHRLGPRLVRIRRTDALAAVTPIPTVQR